MEEAGVRITEHDEGEDTSPDPPWTRKRELRRFREFLDDVEPEDFAG